MIKMHTLKIKEIEFSAGQYLPEEYGNCHNLHGHNYLIKNLIAKTTEIVDFRKFKEAINQFDHCILAPEDDRVFWAEVKSKMSNSVLEDTVVFKVVYIPFPTVTAEYLSTYIHNKLREIKGVYSITFELYETKNNGVAVWPS